MVELRYEQLYLADARQCRIFRELMRDYTEELGGLEESMPSGVTVEVF